MLAHRLAATALSVLAALVCVAAFASPAAPAQNLQSQLETKQSKLDEVHERKGVLTTTISRYGDQIDRLIGEVAAIRGREAVAQGRLAAKQTELDGAVAVLEQAQGRLAKVRTHLRRALAVLRQRLVAMYETGTPDMLSVIVGATGVDEIAAQAEYLDRLRGMDEAVVGRVRELRNQVGAIVAGRRAAKRRIESARNVIASEERSLAASRAALQSHQQALLTARADRVAALAQIGEQEEELDGSVAAIQDKLAAELAATGSTPLPAGPIQEGSGGLIWPVSGPIASGFGSRTINGSYEYHPGIDIAVPEGTPIRAAADGTVVLQQSEAESGGYGNYTCIDHGGGLSTCYAHQSSFAVSAGQSVSQGEIIGYTGCTGYCLGPHLHFEVRIYGEVTDPMGYL